MKIFKFTFVLVCAFVLFCNIACNDDEQVELTDKYAIYTVYEGDIIEYPKMIGRLSKDKIKINSEFIEILEVGIKGIKVGNELIVYEDYEIGNRYNIEINVLEKKPAILVDESIEVYIYETKEIEFDVENGDKDDVKFFTSTTTLGLNGNSITPTDSINGVVFLQIGDDESTKVAVRIVVKEIIIVIKNDDLNMDITDENIAIEYEIPNHIDNKVIFISKNEKILRVTETGVIIPVREGRASLEISIDGYENVKTKIVIEISVDPEKVINALHIQEVLMRKDVVTNANTIHKQDVYGSVTRYFYSDLNLISDIKPINQNEYTGQVATPEILETVEPMKKVRSGVLLEELKYIIYHDTGNNNAGSDALMHSKFMVGTWNIENNRARSWHYTVDEKSVYHHIPDNEVTWQGDSYESYAKSIGVETCIDYGCDLYTVWRRTGKLMATLIDKYNLSIDCIKQHYDMSGKDCPRTLRASGLYDYAIDLVAGELLFLRALSDYSVKFESLTPEFLDNTGKIIKNPTTQVTVKYNITITGTNYNKTLEFSSIVNPVK